MRGRYVDNHGCRSESERVTMKRYFLIVIAVVARIPVGFFLPVGHLTLYGNHRYRCYKAQLTHVAA